jgi:hypothetical protein
MHKSACCCVQDDDDEHVLVNWKHAQEGKSVGNSPVFPTDLAQQGFRHGRPVNARQSTSPSPRSLSTIVTEICLQHRRKHPTSILQPCHLCKPHRTMSDASTPKPSSSVKLVLLGEAAVGKVHGPKPPATSHTR